MKEKFSFKRFICALGVGLVGAFAISLAPALLIPVVAVMGFAAVFWGLSYCQVMLAMTMIGSAIFMAGDTVGLISVLAGELIGTTVLAVGLYKKWPYRYIALALAGVLLASLYANYALPSVLAGKEPYAGVVEMLNELRALSESYGTGSEMLKSMDAMIEDVPKLFFGALVMLSEAGSLAAVVLAYAMAKRSSADTRRMAPFIEWQLPQSLKIALPAIAAIVALTYLAKLGAAPTVFYTVACTLLPLFMAVGFAFMLFIARHRPAGKGFMTAFAIAVLLLTPVLVALMGVFDLYVNIRGKVIRTDKLIRAAFERAEREHLDSVVVDFGDGRGPQVIAVRKKRNSDAFFDNRSEKENEKEDGGNVPADTGGENGAAGEGETSGSESAGSETAGSDETDNAGNDNDNENNDSNDNNGGAQC